MEIPWVHYGVGFLCVFFPLITCGRTSGTFNWSSGLMFSGKFSTLTGLRVLNNNNQLCAFSGFLLWAFCFAFLLERFCWDWGRFFLFICLANKYSSPYQTFFKKELKFCILFRHSLHIVTALCPTAFPVKRNAVSYSTTQSCCSQLLDLHKSCQSYKASRILEGHLTC